MKRKGPVNNAYQNTSSSQLPSISFQSRSPISALPIAVLCISANSIPPYATEALRLTTLVCALATLTAFDAAPGEALATSSRSSVRPEALAGHRNDEINAARRLEEPSRATRKGIGSVPRYDVSFRRCLRNHDSFLSIRTPSTEPGDAAARPRCGTRPRCRDEQAHLAHLLPGRVRFPSFPVSKNPYLSRSEIPLRTAKQLFSLRNHAKHARKRSRVRIDLVSKFFPKFCGCSCSLCRNS